MEAPATLAEAVLSEEPIKRDRVLSAHEKAAAAQERRRLLEVQKKAEQAELAKKASMREAQMAERLAKKNAGIRMKEALARAAAEKKAEDRQKYNMLETARLLQIREEKARADAERKQLDDARKIEEKHRRRSAVEPTIPRAFLQQRRLRQLRRRPRPHSLLRLPQRQQLCRLHRLSRQRRME